MSRRDQIRMTDQELASFIENHRTVTCASVGPNGRPHLMPLWFCLREGRVACWTYASSQKAKNLERLPEATLQLESGDSYEELRGVMMECDVELLHDVDEVAAVGLALTLRYAPGDLGADDAPDELRAFVAKQAAKRVAMVFEPTRTLTWDHRKLAGAY
jgi:hypothetical protein